MDEIEFEAPVERKCSCCGSEQQILTRYVTQNGSAFAIYKALLTFGHGVPRAQMIAGFGDWEEDSDPAARTAIVFDLWSDRSATNVTITNEQESGWSSGFVGVILEREAALQHPLAKEVYELADHIARCDKEVIAFLP